MTKRKDRLAGLQAHLQQEQADDATQSSEKPPIIGLGTDGKTGVKSEKTIRDLIKMVDPKRCRLWVHHDRDDVWYTEERCRDVIELLREEEQIYPVLARPVKDSADYDYEIIYGARRRFATEFLGKALAAKIIDCDDKRAFKLMDIENRGRKDPSIMENARSYLKASESGLYKNIDEVATFFKRDKGTVSRYIRAAKLLYLSFIETHVQDITKLVLDDMLALDDLLNESPKHKEYIRLQAKNNGKAKSPRIDAEFIKWLISSTRQKFKKAAPFPAKDLVIGGKKVKLKRDAKGKINLVFTNLEELEKMDFDELLDNIKSSLK